MQYITSQQMTKVDQLAVDKYGISVLQMMENAGRNVTRFIASLNPKHVLVLYGKGNNGGDGLCSARHLSIMGIKTTIVGASDDLNSNTQNQLKTLNEMGIKPSTEIPEADVILDSLLGYNIDGNPRDKFAELINKANEMRKKGTKIVSFDLPSGMNPNTGEKLDPCIEADYILTLALPKIGLKELNNLYLVNIGIPNELYSGDLEIEVENYFKESDVVKIS